MWKKLLVVCIAFMGTIGVAYAFQNEMLANEPNMPGSASDIAGTIFPSMRNSSVAAPSKTKIYFGDNSTNFAVQRNDCKMPDNSLPVINCNKDDNVPKNEIVWEFITDVSSPGSSSKDLYLLQPDGIIGVDLLFNGNEVPANRDYTTSTAYQFNLRLNNSLNALEKSITNPALSPSYTINGTTQNEGNVFTPSFSQFGNGQAFGLNSNLRRVYKTLVGNQVGNNVGYHYGTYPLAEFGASYWHAVLDFIVTGYTTGDIVEMGSIGQNYLGMRPVTGLYKDKMVFAIEPLTGTSNSYAKIDASLDTPLKLRALDANLKVDLDTITIGDVGQGGIIDLSYSNATTGSNQYISALITDTAGNLIYYQVLEKAKSGVNNPVTIDTSNMTKDIDYNIQLVNETVTTGLRPTTSSALTTKVAFKVVNPLSDLTHTPTNGTQLTKPYTASANGNVKNNDTIATVTTKNGAGNATVNGVFENDITYKLISSTDSTHTNDTNLFEIPLDTTTNKPLLDANTGTPYIVAKPATGQSGLAIGAYKYRVQAYDKNGDPVPAQLNNGTTVNGINPNQGLITDDILMVVYPHEDQISYTQTKHNNKFYTKNELNGSTVTTATDLGQISFQSGINIQKLQTDGYVIDNIKLVKTGTTTELSELQTSTLPTTLGDPITIVKKSGASFTGSITFDMIITFKESASNTKTAQLTKSGLVFEVPGDLRFAQQVNGTTSDITTSTLTKTYDPVTTANNTFLLWANDSATTPLPKNSRVTYCIVDPATNDCDATGGTATGTKAYTIANQADGTTNITLNGPGTTKKDSTIRASLLDTNGNVLTFSDLKIEVEPAKQILTWEGDGVTQASSSTDTWEVSLPWSGGTDTYTIDELLNSAARTNKLAIKNNIASGATTSIKYTLSLRIGPTDTGKVTISNASPYTLTITGSPQQAVYIEAERAGDGNYGPSAIAKLKLNISQLPVLSFTYDQSNGCSNAMTSGTTCTTSSDMLGKLSIAPTVTNPSYSLVKAEQSLDDGQSYRDTALNTFLLNTSNGEGEVKIGTSNLTNGKYKLTFGGSDGTNTLANIEVIFTVGDASFDTSNWTWKAGDINALQQVGTGVDPTTKDNDATYQRTYAPKTNTNPATSPDKFQVKLEGLPSGASVTYSLKQTTPAQTAISKTSGTTNSFDVLSTGGGSGTGLMIQADVTMSGYASTTVYLPIEIVKYTQTIAFDTTNPVTIYLPDNAPCTSITAKKTSTFYDTTTPITYSTTGSTFTINANNEVCPVAMPSGTVAGSMTSSETLDASLASSTNYTSASATQNIIIYKPGSIDVSKSIETVQGTAGNITYTPYANASDMSRAHAGSTSTQKNGYKASTNDIVGQVKLTGINGDPTESYKKSANPTTTPANRNANMFTVNSATGSILLTQDVTARDIVNQGGNIFYLQVDVKDYLGYTQTVDVQIKIESAIPDFYFTDVTGAKLPTNASLYVDNSTSVPQYVFTFAKNGNVAGTFDIFTNRSDAILSEDTATGVDLDVIEYQSGNQFDMVHATDEAGQYGGSGGKAYVKAHVNAGAGYTAMDIYAEVKLERAPQPDFAFATSSIHIAKSSSGIVPTYVGHLDSGDVTITASNDPTVAVAGNYTPGSDQEITPIDVGGPASITAHAPGDRDFLPADASVDVYVSEHPTTTLTLHVNQPIYYGDTGKIATIISGYKSNLPAYFSSSDPAIVSIQDTNTADNKADLTILKPGRVDIEVCQTDKAGFQAGDPCPGSGAEYGITTIQIYPRPLKVKLLDETIYKGEGFPVYALEASPIGGTSFVGNDSMQDIPLPASTSARDGVSVLANTNMAGDYPIQGSYSSAELATIPILQNYKVTIVDGNLKIVEDPSSASWYHLEGADTGATLSPNDWHNEDVYIKLDTASGGAGSYDQISNTDAFANMDKTKFLVMDEDKTTPDVYFRIDPNGGTAHAGAIAEKQTALVKIDKTQPKVTGAKGTPSNTGIFAQLMNTLTFHTFFKPGVEIVIQTSDPQPAGSAKVVEVSGVKSVDYTVYEVDEKTGVIKTEVTPMTGSGTVGSDGAFSFHISKVGTYKVCAVAHDNAGNDSVESCYYANVKKIDVDGDGDGIPDFNDPDGDGCPDLNIILGKDSDGDDIKLNVAKKGENKPYLNIDTDGDGKPDINIDTDKDGKPDLNIMNVTSWNPTKCVTGQVEEYCTDGTLIPNINVDIQGDGPGTPPDGRPDINIDLDGDGIPDIDIDTDGDGIPDINVDTNRDGTPDEKIKKLDKWVIDPNIFEANGKKFQTMTGIEPDVIDEIRDGDFILVPSEGTHFQPGYTLVIDDITGTMDDGTRTNINTQVPGGQEIKYVYDVQLWDGTKHIQPDGKVKVKIPTIDGIENPKLVLEQPDGTYITVDAVIEDGHYVYETDFLGKVSIIGDKEAGKEPSTTDPVNTDTKEPVKGSYTSSIGGALTGDSTHISGYILILFVVGMCITILCKKTQEKR